MRPRTLSQDGDEVVLSKENSVKENDVENSKNAETFGEESKNQTPSKPNEVEQKPFDADFNVQEKTVIRRFIFINNSNYQVQVKLNLQRSSDILNTRLPASSIGASVRPRMQQQILFLMKVDSELDWGQYDINCTIQKIEWKNNPFSKNEKILANNEDESNQKRPKSFQIRPIDITRIDREEGPIVLCDRCSAINNQNDAKCKSCHQTLKKN